MRVVSNGITLLHMLINMSLGYDEEEVQEVQSSQSGSESDIDDNSNSGHDSKSEEPASASHKKGAKKISRM